MISMTINTVHIKPSSQFNSTLPQPASSKSFQGCIYLDNSLV